MRKLTMDDFYERIDYDSQYPHWIWTGKFNSEYPLFGNRYAHRYSYQELVGPIPDGYDIDHIESCRITACVNPKCLKQYHHMSIANVKLSINIEQRLIAHKVIHTQEITCTCIMVPACVESVPTYVILVKLERNMTMSGDTKKVFAEYYERDPDHPNWILFDPDVSWRKELFGPEVVSHPAKMQLHIVRAAVNYFAQPGWVILDPFAGTGTTALAATMGYQTYLIELEQHFIDLLLPIRQKWIAANTISGIDQMVILTGDCRRVMADMPENLVDMIITSPPYSVTAQVGKEVTEFTGVLAERKAQMRKYGSGEASVNNIGRLNPFMFNRAMSQVYKACARVLKPGGLYVSVTKDRMLAGQRQMLSMDIIRAASESGFEYTGNWWKWKAPGGLMQNIMKSKGADIVEDEDIVVFRKPVI